MDSTIKFQRIVYLFKTGKLSKDEWTHHAHLAVCVWHLLYFTHNEALTILRREFTKYNETVGTVNSDTSGYHETMTQFWVSVVRLWLLGKPTDDFERLCQEIIKSELADTTLPLQCYDKNILFSAEARKQYILPAVCIERLFVKDIIVDNG